MMLLHIKRIIVYSVLGMLILYGCSSIRPKVSLPNYTLLKEYEKEYYHFNPNGPMGSYIILNNNLQTYVMHSILQEEIGIWRMRGDTLFLEPQLFTSLSQEDPGIFHQMELIPRQFLMSKEYAYEITDYWKLLSDSIINSSDSVSIKYYQQMDSIAISNEKIMAEKVRTTYLIMQKSAPFKYQRDFDW